MIALLKLTIGTALAVLVTCMVLADLAAPGPSYICRFVCGMVLVIPAAALICRLAPHRRLF